MLATPLAVLWIVCNWPLNFKFLVPKISECVFLGMTQSQLKRCKEGEGAVKKIKCFMICAVMGLLSACGGGGGDPGRIGATNTSADASNGSNSNSSDATGTSNSAHSVSDVRDFDFGFDKRFIKNSGSDKAKLTVKALDANRNALAGVPITVNVDKATFTPAVKVTDDAGNYSGDIEIGQDRSNRTVTVTISAGRLTKTSTIFVTGNVITANIVPANPAPGQQVTLEFSVRDSANIPIPLAPLTFSGTFGVLPDGVTDENGILTTTITAPSSAGTYTLLADGLGFRFKQNIQVLAAANVPSAIGVIGSADLSANPTALSPNLNGSTTNKARLRAKFMDATNTNQGIKNIRVQFRITSKPLAGESISVGDGIVYTDDNGEAFADYIPGSASSATDGIEIKACYKTSDFTIAELQNNCASLVGSQVVGITKGKKLSVASDPVSIAISNYAKLEKGPSGINYLDKLLIQVTDAVGQGVPGALVSASLDITHYGKGYYAGGYDLGDVPPPAAYASQDAIMPTPSRRIWCANEDINRNQNTDPAEDKNGNGWLDPKQAAISFTFVDGKSTTDDNGQAFIKVSFGQKYATWLAYTLTVTTGVKGSEGRTAMRFLTAFTVDDKDNGTFHDPPYGTGRCDSEN